MTSRTGTRLTRGRGRGRLAAVLATTTLATLATAVPALQAHAAQTAAASTASAKAPAKHLLTDDEARAQARKTGKAVPVTGATTASSTLTANPSGSFTLTQQNQPVRKNVHGTWKPLDATLHRNADGTVSPAVTTSTLTLSGGGTGPLAAVTFQGHTLSLTLPQALPAPVLSGATATYKNYPVAGADLEITADAQGDFEDVIVVKNAAAASSPALRALTFRPSVTGGLTLHADAHGNVAATSRDGKHPFFQIPAATMWDSRPAASNVKTGTDPAYGGRKVDLRNGQPVTSAAASPGENARTARLGTHLSAGTLTYTPDRSLLTGKDTVYPLYLDPAAGSVRGFWAQVDSAWPSQTYPKPNPMQVGYNIWQPTYFTARSFVNESVSSTLHGSDVESATLYLTDDYAPTCNTSAGDEGVQVWRTSAVSSSATWSSQPTWTKEESEKSFVHGYDSSCPAAAAGFDVTEAMTTAAADSWNQVTFGIRADSESDEYGWKQFSSTVSLSTTFDKAPNAPGNLRTSPVTSCTGTTVTTVGLGDVILYATLSDPLGSGAGSLSSTVSVTDQTTGAHYTASATKGASSPFTVNNLGSGSVVTIRLHEADLKAMTNGSINEFAWSATATDGTLTSPVSKTCHFNFNPTSPGAPTVCPDAGCDATPPAYTIGSPATFDITPDDDTITPTSYTYQVNGGATQTVTPASTAVPAGSASITVTPTSGANVLTVTAVAAGGNVGESYNGVFTAHAPANAADGDLTGDGVPDLIAPGGGTTSLASGLWLARGAEAGNGDTGNGQVLTSAVNIGTEGNGVSGNYSPADFNGAQAITGLFGDNGFQDTLIYYPPGSGTYADQGVILDGMGDGSVVSSQDAYTPDPDTGNSALSWRVVPDVFTVGDPNQDSPLQVANAYNADSGDNPEYPDLITVSGDATNGYNLDFLSNCNEPACWVNDGAISADTPDGTSWDQWKITTMAEPSGAVDMFLYSTVSHALYLWQDLTITPDVLDTTAAYTQYELSASWNPGTLAELRAADITGSGPALWTVTTGGQATAWTVSHLDSTPTVTASTAQSLLTADHTWQLANGTDSTVTKATDQPGSGDTAIPLSLSGGATWNTGDYFSPDIALDGSSGYLIGSGPAVTTTGRYTISAWVNPTITGTAIFSQNGSLYSGIIVANTGGHWELEVNGTDTSLSSYTTATGGTVHPGAWTQLTLTHDTTGIYKLYANGTEIISLRDTTALNSGGRFLVGALQMNGDAHSLLGGQIADVQAWNSLAVPNQPSTPGSRYVPVTPSKILDTRSGYKVGAVTGPVAGGATITVPIANTTTPGGDAIPATGVTAASLAVSGLSPAVNGNIIAYPDGTSRPVTATASFPAGTNVTENAIIPVGPDGKIALENDSGGTLDFGLVITGYFTTGTAAGAGAYQPLTAPSRILDTRNGTGAPKAQIPATTALPVKVTGITTTSGDTIPAAGVTAVALNVTVVPPAGDNGWLSFYPDGTTRPDNAAELNFDGTASQAAGTIITVSVSGTGKIDIYNGTGSPLDVVGDISGYFTSAGGGQLYHPLNSTRLTDTRQASGIPANGTIQIGVPASIPAGNPSLVTTITDVDNPSGGILTAYPASATSNGTSTINLTAGQAAGNFAIVNTASANAFKISSTSPSPVQVVVDTNGYFS